MSNEQDLKVKKQLTPEERAEHIKKANQEIAELREWLKNKHE